MMSQPSKTTKEILAKKLELACQYIRSLPVYRDHPAQQLHLTLAATPGGYRPLHYAAACGNIELTTLLANIFSWLKLTPALNARDSRGLTALHWATIKGFGNVIQTLVESGASLNIIDEQGRTPLHLAVSALEIYQSYEERKFCRDMVRYFLEHGANPNVGDEYGTCPLHLAAQLGDEEMLNLLVSYGASVHVRDNEGESAIFYAIRGPHISMVTKLVEEHKIDLLARNEDGETPAEYCKALGDMVLFRLIESLIGPTNSTATPSFPGRNQPVPKRMRVSNDSVDNSPDDDDGFNLSLSAGSRFTWDSLVIPSSV